MFTESKCDCFMWPLLVHPDTVLPAARLGLTGLVIDPGLPVVLSDHKAGAGASHQSCRTWTRQDLRDSHEGSHPGDPADMSFRPASGPAGVRRKRRPERYGPDWRHEVSALPDSPMAGDGGF